ncbi:DUF3007 family protein [Synechocystis sp. PCC 7509]|uniref:DUF3007 family protein n=1 Tax=Synechocystis sp. PCC 7509 TaxID=927677 RepID=UPI0002AC9DF5|nr:DUF3007 family protein [Synechocystis sp. PCC 7509]
MRKIDVLGIGIGVFVAGGLVYVVLQVVGLDNLEAGIWSQLLLVAGLIGWIATYITRAASNKMTYHQQREAYEQAYFKKRIDELTPEQLANIQAEIDQEKSQTK